MQGSIWNLKIASTVMLACFFSLQVHAVSSVETDVPVQALANTDETQLNTSSATEEIWGDDNWGEETKSPWKYSGFVEAAQGNFLQHNVVKSGASLSELRTRIELSYSQMPVMTLFYLVHFGILAN